MLTQISLFDATIFGAWLAALGAFLFFIHRKSAVLTGHRPSSSKLTKAVHAARKAYEERRYREAADLYVPIIEAFRQMGNIGGVVSASTMAGICHEKLGAFQEALRTYSSVIVTSYRQDYEDSIFLAHRRAAYCHLMLGEPDAARGSFRKLSQLCRGLGKHEQSIRALAGMGNIFRGRGELDGAAEAYEQALQLSDELESANGRRLVLHDKALLLRTMGQLNQALTILEESVRLSADTCDAGGQSHMYVSYADTLRMLGRMSEAETAQKRAMALAVVSAVPRFLCLAKLCASQNGWHRGQRGQALELLKAAEDLLDTSSKDLRPVVGLVKANYFEQNNEFNQALSILDELENNGQELKPRLKAALFNIRIRALAKSGRPSEAVSHLQLSHQTAQLLKAPLYLAEYEISAGVVSFHLKNYDEALMHFGSALDFFARAGWVREIATIERYRASAFAAAGDHASAANSAQQAKKGFLQLGDVSSAENVTAI